jgi:succinoglycan biosynthesis transport protein ExoP
MDQDPAISTSAPRQATAREFLAVLFRRRGLILGLFAVTMLTVLVVAFATQAEYISVGRVLIKRGEKESSLSPQTRLVGDWEEDMGSEVEVVKSHPVLERTAALLRQDAGPGRTAPAVDSRSVDVEVTGRTNVVAIGYLSPDPQVARQVCAALVHAYIEFRESDYRLASPANFFQGEMGQAQKDLDYWIEMRRKFSNVSQVVDLERQKSSLIDQQSVLRQRLDEVEANLAEATMVWKQAVDLRDNQSADLSNFSSANTNENELAELKKKIVEQELQVARLRENLRDDSPVVVGAVATLDTLKALMRREVDARIAMTKSRVDILGARRAVIIRDAAEIDQLLAAMPDKEQTLAEMDHKIETLKDRYKDLSAHSDQALINENTTPSRSVVLLSDAGPATRHNARDYVRLALAPAFSIVVGIGLAFFMDGLDLTVRTPHHAEEAIDLPVLATLTERRRSKRGSRDLSLETPNS